MRRETADGLESELKPSNRFFPTKKKAKKSDASKYGEYALVLRRTWGQKKAWLTLSP